MQFACNGLNLNLPDYTVKTNDNIVCGETRFFHSNTAIILFAKISEFAKVVYHGIVFDKDEMNLISDMHLCRTIDKFVK